MQTPTLSPPWPISNLKFCETIDNQMHNLPKLIVYILGQMSLFCWRELNERLAWLCPKIFLGFVRTVCWAGPAPSFQAKKQSSTKPHGKWKTLKFTAILEQILEIK